MTQKKVFDLRRFVISGMFGILGSTVSLLLVTVIASMLICGGKIEENMVFYLCAGIMIVASFVGALIASNRMGDWGLVAALLSGGLLMALLSILNIILFDGMFENIGASALLIMGSSLGGGLLRQHKKSQHYSGKNKKRKLNMYRMHK